MDDVLPTIQWTRNFMFDQGYDLETIIKEDNRSTMLPMKNGKLSSGKRTKHLDIRYFYVKDLLDRGIVKIEHCVSNDMIADFLTKSIQGSRFQILRDIILNLSSSSALQYRSVLGNSVSTETTVQADETSTSRTNHGDRQRSTEEHQQDLKEKSRERK